MKQRLNRAIVSSQVCLSQLTELCALPLHSVVVIQEDGMVTMPGRFIADGTTVATKLRRAEKNSWREVPGGMLQGSAVALKYLMLSYTC